MSSINRPMAEDEATRESQLFAGGYGLFGEEYHEKNRCGTGFIQGDNEFH